MKLIAFSQDDIAGKNIADILVEQYEFEDREGIRVLGFKKSFLFIENFNAFKPDICIVASRHRSESGKPTLTCHPTGNFGKATLGGNSKKLAIAPALYLRESSLCLKRSVGDLSYDVSLEVTHHGPTELPFPVLFIEVGSTEKQWRDMEACEVVAKTIDDMTKKEPENVPVAIGFGGPHYAPNFSQVIEKVALGHIAPKYAIRDIDEDMIAQMIAKTVPKPDFALFDWKGLRGEERKKIINMLDELKVEWKKTSEFKS